MSGNRYFSEAYSTLSAKRVNSTEAEASLTDGEVQALESRITALGLDYYGIKVNKDEGIYFDMTQEGELYSVAEDLTKIFESVANTVRFSGVVEIRSHDVDEFSRFEINDSIVSAEKNAVITWV